MRVTETDPGWNVPVLRKTLLAWYRANRRDLPWRESRDPYAIWVSEIMLQQTRVAVVIERYKEFLARFPAVVALARAQEEEVLALWSGLGYYRRARMMHKAAQVLAEDHDGYLPRTSNELIKLPGIGSYTAAAIASIAHGEPVAVIDGNVERVLCRLAGWDADSSKGASALQHRMKKLAAELLDPAHPGDFNQAMMELGATVCLPRNPQCEACPWSASCRTRGEHKTTPRAKMQSREAGYALVLRNAAKEVLLEQRPAAQTVMPGLWELPMLSNVDVPPADLALTVRHAIMQVNYRVRVRNVREKEASALAVMDGERRWVRLNEAAAMPLTGLARKVLTRLRLIHSAVK